MGTAIQRPNKTNKVGNKVPKAVQTSPDYRIEALAKGLTVLGLFTEQRPMWRVKDLAEAAGIPMPTAFRLVMTLAEEGYLDHLPSGEYRPGVRTLTLGTAALRSLDLVTLATPLLQSLASATGETVNLATLSGDAVLYLVRLRNADLVTANIQVGSTLPAVTTSIGKTLLASLPDKQLRDLITDSSFPIQRGPNAKTTFAELAVELDRIRTDGWALQDEELSYGLRSIAGPIINASGRTVAGVNVVVQARDWSIHKLIRKFKDQLLETCASISALLPADAAVHSTVSTIPNSKIPTNLKAD
jgi:IclR family transcriptional regulator, pca regulon regulatory protein